MNQLLRIYIVLLCAGLSASATAQSVPSLEITPDARSMGMASASVALEGNAFSVFKNTAAASFSPMTAAAAYSYTNWFGGNTMHAAGSYFKWNDKHTAAMGIRYFDAEKVFVSEDGLEGKDINPYDIALDLGYAYRLNSRFSLSANVRYIHSKISEGEGVKNGNALSFDAGAHFRLENYSAGLTLSGLGTTIDYGFGSHKLPARLLLGGAYSFTPLTSHRLQVSVEGEYRFMPNDYEHIGAGAGLEYTCHDWFSLRGGYRLGDKNKSQGNYGVLGAGIDLKCVFVDFAYTLTPYDSLMRNVWQASAGVRF